MKKIWMILISVILVFTAVPVYAAEENDIQITCNKLTDHDIPYTSMDEDGNEITVYTLSALVRYSDQTIDVPNPRCFTLISKNVDLSNIKVEMDTSSDNGLGKKDIKLAVKSRKKEKAEIEANFSSKKVTTQLNFNARILIKDDSGKILTKIALAYSTPALTDEHDARKFHTMSAWSGKRKYDADTSEEYKVSGMIDVYQTSAKLTYTYQSMGTFGVKAFMLDPAGDFKFSNGKTTWTAKNGKPNQKNTITLVCKPSYLKALKKKLQYDYCKKDEDGVARGSATEDIIFNDVSLEYKNVNGKTYENGQSDNGQGCTIGGVVDPINLAHYATVKPQQKVKIKSYKKTKTSITLKWKKLSVPVSGYRIYRSTKKSSGYKRIKTVSSKTTSYKNKKLKKKKTYYYKIRPYRNITYTYKNKKNKKKKLTRKVYGSYSNVKKTKTSK